MHLIVLEPHPSSHRGGQEISLFDICRGLAERGHKISLLYCQEDNLLEQYQKFCIHTIKVNKFFIYRPQDILPFFADLRKISQLSITSESLVLSNQFQDTLFGHALSLINNIPLICYFRLPPPPKHPLVWHPKLGVKGIKFITAVSINRCVWKMGLQGVNRFVAVSQQTKLDWVKRGHSEEMIDVVYNGINPEVFTKASNFEFIRKQWKIDCQTRVISFVGRIDQEKGLETLIQAFALLLKSHLHTKLLIAGKPINNGEDYQKSLESLVTDLGIEKYVDFLGHITDSRSIYQVSDVTVLASLWSEPFPRSIIESMACGTPVVASRTGGIPESLTGEFQNGLFEPGNPTDLADALKQILNWRDLDPDFGERCIKHISANFSSVKMINGIEKVLEQVVHQKSLKRAFPKLLKRADVIQNI